MRMQAGLLLGGAMVVAQLVLAPAEALAQGSATEDREELLERINRKLAKHEWKAARRQAVSLGSRLESESWNDRRLEPLLAAVARYRAIAEINLGLDREAIWHWHLAWNLRPPTATDTELLSSLGRASQLLEVRLRRRGEMPPSYRQVEELEMLRIEPPEIPAIERPFITNAGASRAGLLPDLQVEVLIDRQGRMLHPVVEDTGVHPVLIYATLDWMLTYPPVRPAHVDGEPIDYLQQLSITLSGDR